MKNRITLIGVWDEGNGMRVCFKKEGRKPRCYHVGVASARFLVQFLADRGWKFRPLWIAGGLSADNPGL